MFVFDDTDPELDAYLGVAEVPLLPLAHDTPVTGQFQLTRGQGKIAAGVIEVELKWQYTYLPPKVAKHLPQEVCCVSMTHMSYGLAETIWFHYATV